MVFSKLITRLGTRLFVVLCQICGESSNASGPVVLVSITARENVYRVVFTRVSRQKAEFPAPRLPFFTPRTLLAFVKTAGSDCSMCKVAG